jgi:hypothetical protein
MRRSYAPFMVLTVVLAASETVLGPTGALGQDIYALDSGQFYSQIAQYTTTGGTVNSSLISLEGFYAPSGIALSGSNIFVANAGVFDTISEYTTSGGTLNASLISGLSAPEGIAVSGQNLFVANFFGGTVGEYTTTGGVVNPALVSGLRNPTAIAVSGGDLFVLNGSTIGEYTISGGTVNPTLISGLNDAYRIAVSGGSLFVTMGGDNGVIAKYTTSGGLVNAALISGLDLPQAIAVSGQNLFVCNLGTQTIGEYTTSGATVNAALISGVYADDMAIGGIGVQSTSVVWAQPVSGQWSMASNWSPTTVPTSSISATFATGSTNPYTVTLTGPAAASNLMVQGDTVTLSLGNNELVLAGSLSISAGSQRGSLVLNAPSGGGIVVPGGLFVGSSSSSPTTASATVAAGTVTANVTAYGTLSLLQGPTIEGNLNNSGIVRTWTSSATAPGNFVTINGNYLQTTSGTLAMQVSGGPGGIAYDSIAISGTASFGGTLDISVNGTMPPIDTTMPIIAYGSLASRFNSLVGSVPKDTNGNLISSASTEFFGLLYGANTMSLITLQVPQLANGQPLTTQGPASGLVLLTHGWNSNVGVWATSMGTSIQASNVARHVSQSWDVVTMDWSYYAATGINPFTSPEAAAVNGNDIGESLANWMHEKGFNYTTLDLIGHSAGAWLINGLNNGLINQGSNPIVQQTYLDAYNPGGLAFYGYAAGNTPVLGKNATYAEQYYNGGDYLPGLATVLPNAVNFDINGLYVFSGGNPINPLSLHAWPYTWYGMTVLSPTGSGSASGFGFAQSADYSPTGQPPVYKSSFDGVKLTPGAVVYLDYPYSSQYTGTQYTAPVDLLSLPNVIQGSVESPSPGVVQLAASSTESSNGTSPTGPASILTDQITFSSPENLLSLSGQFQNDPDGLLSVYFDGTLLTEVAETDTGSSSWDIQDLNLGSLEAAGVHTLMLRLDPFDGYNTTLNISDVEFGVTTVPEPSSLMLLAAAASGLILFRYQRQRRRIGCRSEIG